MTATTRTGIAKIAFPAGKNAAVLFNASGSNNNNGLSQVTINPATNTISGFTTAKTVCNEGSYRIFFSTTFDQPFTAVGKWQGGTSSAAGTGTQTISSAVTTTTTDSKNGRNAFGVVLKFADGANVEMRTGISYVSDTNAELNRTQEAPAATSFATLRAAAKTTWENALGTLNVTGGSDKERTKFYTALYHSLLHPNIYEDVNGQYRGYYKDAKAKNDWPTSGTEIKTLAAGQQHEYVTYSSWDSLRGQMQLIAMLFPKVGSDMAASIYNMSDQVGTWYNWPHLGSAQKKMEGDGMQSIVASLYAFGSTDFDASAAVDSMVSATSLGKSSYFRANFVQYAGTSFIEDRWTTAASTTMDYAMADFGVAQLAERVGKTGVHDDYMVRAQSWRSLVSQDAAYPNRIVPRDRKGFWASFELNNRSNSSGAPDSGAQNRDLFDQSTGLQYQWYMTQNIAGVIDALGGKAAAETKLDGMFNYPTLDRLDVSGSSSNGAYMSNQPSMHSPWVYSWLGKPVKTTQVLDKARSTMYFADAIDTSVPAPANPGFAGSVAVGLPGNDDLGSLSSWYVWSSIGLYPAIFGRAELLVSSPAFDAVTITSHQLDGTNTPVANGGRTISISAPGQAANRYISAISVNGQNSTKSYLPETFTRSGGTLNLTMTSATNSSWGTGTGDVPPSFNDQRNAYNAVGTGQIGTANAGSLDVGGVTLPRSTLASAGATPGAALQYGGVTYPWPNSAPLKPDHWVPNGQAVTINARATKVGFLGVATNGPSSGTAKIVFTDGTSQNAAITFPDWTSGVTEGAVITGTGRLSSGGTLDSSTWRLYTAGVVSVPADKRISQIVLPSDVTSGLMHIFAVGTNASETPQESIELGNTEVGGGEPVAVTGAGLEQGDVVTISVSTTPATTKSVTVGANGEFSLAVTLGAVPAGTYQVVATVQRTGQTPSVFPLGSVHVTYAPALTSVTRAVAGSPVAFSGTGYAPGEVVTVSLGSAQAQVTAGITGSISGSITAPLTIGIATLTATGAVSQAPVTHSLAVVYPAPGDDPIGPGGGNGAVATNVTLTSSAASVVYGKAVTLTASVSDGAAGSVVFLANGIFLGEATISGGKATTSVKLPAGTYRPIATYLGSPTHLAATGTAGAIQVAKAKTSSISVSAKKYKRKKAAKVTVSVGKLSNGSYPAGTVSVLVGKKTVAAKTLSVSKKGKVTVKIPAKYTKKKSLKVKAKFAPSDSANITGKTSKVRTVKAK